MNYSITKKTIIAGLFACLASGSIQAITWKEYVKQNGVPQIVDGVLDLSWRELEDIDFADIENKESIKELNLNGNQLQSLPPEIGQLKNLEELWLACNNLQELPRGIGQLKNLQELYLVGNKLRELPGEIGKLENLRELDLGWNRLQSLPPTFSILIDKIHGLSPEEIKELQDRFEIQAVEENNLLKVHMFCRERGEQWYLYRKDFKDGQGNNLLHLAIKFHDQEKDPEWKILKELIACNTNDSVVQMLQEENEQGNMPLQLLLANGAGQKVFEEIYKVFNQLKTESDNQATENKGKQERSSCIIQ